MKKEILKVPSAPPAKGPYSTAVALGSLLFISGQGPVDPASGEFLKGTVEEQAGLVMANLSNILNEAGSSLDQVLKVTLYLSNMDNFSQVNEVYKTFFSGEYPARTCIQAGRLPFDIDVEIDVIAYRKV
jgi:2-iminobutanoate/2-iminopropanoate deaminase